MIDVSVKASELRGRLGGYKFSLQPNDFYSMLHQVVNNNKEAREIVREIVAELNTREIANDRA